MPDVKLSKNQQLVLDALSASDAPLGAYDLLDGLRGKGLRSPLQVYRALDKLKQLGLVHRLESLNAFVACVDPDCHDSVPAAFAICENCGNVDEFGDLPLQGHLTDWCRKHRFLAKAAAVEIRGLCVRCS